MSKKQKDTVLEVPQVQAETIPETSVVLADSDHLKALFARGVNSIAPVKGLRFKRTLTRPLLAAAHFKQLLFDVTGDMYIMTLPAKGRGAAPSQARVVDGVDLETGEEATLMCNEMIVGAFKRAGFQTLQPKDGAEDAVEFVTAAGSSLKGHAFAFRAGSINEEKGYRRVDVIEVEVER